MRPIVIVFWLIASVLALDHLLFLAAYSFSLGLAVALVLALACFSLPFFLLTLLRPPPGHRLKTALAVSVAACVIAINLSIPLRRFLPGYHPEPLEALIYLAAPLAECVPIAILRYPLTRYNLSLQRREDAARLNNAPHAAV